MNDGAFEYGISSVQGKLEYVTRCRYAAVPAHRKCGQAENVATADIAQNLWLRSEKEAPAFQMEAVSSIDTG